MKQKEYRRDITGMRTLAVVSVLLYHAGFTWVSGGFVGVDVFFVISGFLITQKIVNEVDERGTFSFGAFYLGRIRRLFPAMFVTLVGSFIAAYFLFPPALMKDFAGSVIASTLSYSNIFFWMQSGYFDTSNDLKPLLHTWSLSIEEQFYLIWPLLLVACLRVSGRRAAFGCLVVISIASLAGSIVWSLDRSSIYYLLPFRVFELGIGALLVFAPKMRIGSGSASILFFSGMIGVVVPILFYTEKTLFPSYNALLPCFGTALMIHFGGGRAGRCAFGNPPMYWGGLISYSLYLVHWPIIVFYGYAIERAVSEGEKLGLCLASVACAVLLYKTVEDPIRKGYLSALSQGWRAWISALVAASLAILPAANAWGAAGWAWRYEKQIAQLFDTSRVSEGVKPYPRNCFVLPTQTPMVIDKECYTVDSQSPKRNILLIGDSTANHLLAGLYTLLEPEANVLIWASSVCPPVRGVDAANNANCRSNMEMFFNEVLPHNQYDLVIASSFKEWDAMREGFPKTVAAFARYGTPVVLVGQSILYRDAPINLVAKNPSLATLPAFMASNLSIGCGTEHGLDKLVAPDRFFSMKARLCADDLPVFQHDGVLINSDVLHLNGFGSMQIAREMVPWLRSRGLL